MNSDQDGFLIPDSRIIMDAMTAGLNLLRTDTSQMVELLQEQIRLIVLQRAVPVNQEQSPDAGGAVPPGANAQRETVPQLTQQQAEQAAIRRAEASRRNREGDSQARDTSGRFGSGSDDDEREKDGIFARLKTAMSGNGPSIGDVDKVDPAIEAANEMKSMLGGAVGGIKAVGEVGKAVIGRGAGGGKKDKAEPWYRRILIQLKLMRKDEREFSLAEIRAIRGSGGGGGGGGDGLIMQGLKLLFSPIGAMLVAGIVAAWSAIGDKLVQAWGGIGNRIVGIWAGIGDRLAQAWDGALTKIQDVFSPISNFFKEKLNIVPKVASLANDKIKAITGIDVGANLTNAAATVSQATATVAATVNQKAGTLLEKVIPNYRHKATFDGIKGGESLEKYGRYTDAEAAKIRALKSSGANTSANLPGGMPKDVQEKIIAQSKAAGIDPTMQLKIAAMESGGNPNAISATGAIGINQIVGGTASGLGVKDRFDLDQNIAGGIKLTKENMGILKAAELPVTAETLYMMHQLGPDAAKEVIRGAAKGKAISSLSKETQSAISKNYGAGAKTASEYVAKNGAALNDRANSVIGKSTAGFLPLSPSTVPAMTRSAIVVPALRTPASMPAATVSVPAVPAAAPRGDIPVPLNSKPPVSVTVKNDQPATQDMKDRRLAHIATGGVSGG